MVAYGVTRRCVQRTTHLEPTHGAGTSGCAGGEADVRDDNRRRMFATEHGLLATDASATGAVLAGRSAGFSTPTRRALQARNALSVGLAGLAEFELGRAANAVVAVLCGPTAVAYTRGATNPGCRWANPLVTLDVLGAARRNRECVMAHHRAARGDHRVTAPPQRAIARGGTFRATQECVGAQIAVTAYSGSVEAGIADRQTRAVHRAYAIHARQSGLANRCGTRRRLGAPLTRLAKAWRDAAGRRVATAHRACPEQSKKKQFVEHASRQSKWHACQLRSSTREAANRPNRWTNGTYCCLSRGMSCG